MQVNVEEQAPGTVALEVLVDEQQYGEAAEEVVVQLCQSVQIPGFRKGKAPRSMVERTLNPETVRARVIDRVLPQAYRQALEESGLQPLTEPEVELLPSEDDRDLRFKLIVHKQPEINPGEIRGLDLVQYVTNITDEDVDREIRNALEARTSYQPVEDAAGEGDVALIDVEVRENDEPIPDASVSELPVQIGAYAQTPAVDDDLLGLKAGDVKDIAVTYPPDFPTEELQGRETIWHVTVGEIRRRQTPELTDEFVKNEIGLETVEEFRQGVREQLEKRAGELDRYSLESQAINKLVDSSEIVFPHILVDQEVDGRRQRLERNLQRSRRSIAEYASSQGVTPTQLFQQMHDQAEEDLRQYLLIHRIAALEGITVAPEEVDAEIERQGAERGARPAIIQIEKQNESRRNAVAYDVLRDRVIKLVLENASITRQEQTLSESDQDGDEEGPDWEDAGAH